MSGHSKWSTIKRKKEAADGAKAQVFTKMGREISIAVREGGPDPNSNFKLAMIITKAKAANVPNDNIDRAIKKAAGNADKEEYEVMIYEGYGPAGVAFMVETLTDNRNRTAGDLRHFFDKNGGNLGQTGCVNFLFEQKGVIVIESEGIDEAQLMDDCIMAGAEDFSSGDEVFEITTAPTDLQSVVKALTAKGYKPVSDEVEYLPMTTVKVDDEDARIKIDKLIDSLDDCDDVSNYWNNMAD